MKRNGYILLFLLGLFVLTGCNEDPAGLQPIEPQPLTKKNRTVINYMIADNNLYGNAVEDINEMESVWSDSFDGYMVVYFYPVSKERVMTEGYDENPRLLLIRSDDGNEIKSQVLKSYDRTQDPNDPEVLKQVMNDVKYFAPADHYGLILWSHGSGWVPDAGPLKSVTVADDLFYGSAETGIWSKIIRGPYAPQARVAADKMVGYSFGEGSYTHGGEMEIYDLATALKQLNITFDFIMFDACHMASIEVAYQLKDLANYFIASAAEIWGYGFPYHKAVPAMMETQADVAQIGEEFFTYYNTFPKPTYREATIVVVNNAKLQNLAKQVSLLTQLPLTGSLTANQQYGRGSRYNDTFYDLTDLVTTAWGGNDMTGYSQALDEAVVYRNATSSFFGIANVTYSGFSCYIPSANTPVALGIYKEKYTWSAASGMGNLVQ